MMETNLPNECLLEIFKYLDRKSLYSVLLVNRTWCRISVPILWRNPFKEYQITNSTNFEPFKMILPLISYLDKETKISLKIDETMTTYYIPKKSTFNYASFIKEMDCINMYHQSITCLKKLRQIQECPSSLISMNNNNNNNNNLYYEMIQKSEKNFNYNDIKHEIESILNIKSILNQEDSNKFVESIYKIIINNSRVESLNLDIFYWFSKDFKDNFNFLSKIPEENGFSGFFLRTIHFKLLTKDVNILFHFLNLPNNQIRDLSLSLYDENEDDDYSSEDSHYLDLINLFKSQHHLEILHVNYNSYFAKLILSELQNNIHSIIRLNLLSHNNIEKSNHYYLNDEWSNSLELTFNDLKNITENLNLKNISFSKLKSLKLDWNTFSFNQLKSQENEIHQSIINLIQHHNIDLKQINLNPLLEFHFKNIFKVI
ncbi:hypothetical protein C1645_872419 [Glomus cerebriforme]|uniref:F-box domain-containing protein n=1 Tax=Glomus cerebriforme TaxID=658196 RepID=A0A397TCH4_9GLOM|nr:hypothetical protein C1645_872419 [Glomus cerebriforme]